MGSRNPSPTTSDTSPPPPPPTRLRPRNVRQPNVTRLPLSRDGPSKTGETNPTVTTVRSTNKVERTTDRAKGWEATVIACLSPGTSQLGLLKATPTRRGVEQWFRVPQFNLGRISLSLSRPLFVLVPFSLHVSCVFVGRFFFLSTSTPLFFPPLTLSLLGCLPTERRTLV